jgi:hypothetical protein
MSPETALTHDPYAFRCAVRSEGTIDPHQSALRFYGYFWFISEAGRP